ncbi:MAG: ATP-binding protein [Victivallaceae bacterium]|nr:ATP-binding protein [Victivallaceae bacterium]
MTKEVTGAGIADFAHIIEWKLFYIDKTEYLWNLINSGGICYFLSRPRRFGKSLTVSTLKAIFQGKKELFKGLGIYDKPYDWKSYSVIHLSLGNYNVVKNALSEFPEYLMSCLRHAAGEHQVVLHEKTPGACFKELISALGKKSDVVILVEEYDKPILNNITNPDLPEIMSILRGFYSSIKDCDQYERFVFITGVSKFSHVSIFSDLNNLKDISMDWNYATMLGFTQEELEDNFGELIGKYASERGMTRDEMVAEIRYWYNGYRFEENAPTVYNPVSATSFFEHGKFLNFWIKTGLSGFLMDLAKSKRYNFAKLPTTPVRDTSLSVSTIDNIKIAPLMFQTGYLTISHAEVINGAIAYYLDFPNREVRASFSEGILECYATAADENTIMISEQLTSAAKAGNTDEMHSALRTFFAGIPYNITKKNEHVFQSIFFSIFRLLGFRILAEDYTNSGRADIVIETEQYIYIFEFKLDNDDSALKQIYEKKYYEKYRLNGKRIILIGVNFSSESGQLCRWEAESLE